jgi:hypothetical protein
MTIGQNAIGPEFLDTSTTPKFRLGTVMKGAGDAEWMYVRAAGAITGAGYVVVIDPVNTTNPYDAAMITNTNGLRGLPVGVAGVAFADNDYGWVQIKGTCQIRTGVAVANVEMATTTTAGELDDAAGTGTKEILGLVLTTARTGSAGNTTGYISYPTVYVTN